MLFWSLPLLLISLSPPTLPHDTLLHSLLFQLASMHILNPSLDNFFGCELSFELRPVHHTFLGPLFFFFEHFVASSILSCLICSFPSICIFESIPRPELLSQEFLLELQTLSRAVTATQRPSQAGKAMPMSPVYTILPCSVLWGLFAVLQKFPSVLPSWILQYCQQMVTLLFTYEHPSMTFPLTARQLSFG